MTSLHKSIFRYIVSWVAIFGVTFGIFSVAHASRVTELEQYYIDRVTDILKTRFPEKPFTVFVAVDTGREESNRKQTRRTEGTKTQLPFLEMDQEQLEIWDRPDIPLGTLISELRAVDIDVKIDSSMTDSEIDELKTSLVKQLRLDDRSDKIQITRMTWTDIDKYKNIRWIGGTIGLSLLLIFGLFWFLARLSVGNLVRGLAKPLAELGQNTKAFAQEALHLASDNGTSSKTPAFSGDSEKEEELSLGNNILELRKAALQVLERNMAIFEKPDARLMELLERKGAEEPHVMGSILAELNEKALKALFKFGWGNWWFVALSQPGPLTGKSVQILSEIDKLRLRRQFLESEAAKTDELREAGLALCRLNSFELAEVFKDTPIEKAEPVLNLLPKSNGLAVAKQIFPGQWALFVQSNRKSESLDENLVKYLVMQSYQIKALRDESEVGVFFADLDFANYLDSASPRDERDFYTVLPVNSRIAMERIPFFQVFDSATDVKRTLGPLLNVRDWALVLFNCDIQDRNSLMEQFSERLRFQINESIGEINPFNLDTVRLRKLRRQIVKACVDQSETLSNMIDVGEASAPAPTAGATSPAKKAA